MTALLRLKKADNCAIGLKLSSVLPQQIPFSCIGSRQLLSEFDLNVELCDGQWFGRRLFGSSPICEAVCKSEEEQRLKDHLIELLWKEKGGPHQNNPSEYILITLIHVENLQGDTEVHTAIQ